MRETSVEREKALSPALRVLLSTHALYYSRQSLLRSLNNIRDGEMELRLSELEVEERTGKGAGEGGKREARPHKVRDVKGRDKQLIIPAASSQRILTRTRQK